VSDLVQRPWYLAVEAVVARKRVAFGRGQGVELRRVNGLQLWQQDTGLSSRGADLSAPRLALFRSGHPESRRGGGFPL